MKPDSGNLRIVLLITFYGEFINQNIQLMK